MKIFALAAIDGCALSRHDLGLYEKKSGNTSRAMKHYMIAAGAGVDDSLEEIARGFRAGHVGKDDYANALCAHQKSTNEMKSKRRDSYEKICREERYR
ncbi:hypothetical protein ACHAWF_008840 [Thalassiosira exigua]